MKRPRVLRMHTLLKCLQMTFIYTRRSGAHTDGHHIGKDGQICKEANECCGSTTLGLALQQNMECVGSVSQHFQGIEVLGF